MRILVALLIPMLTGCCWLAGHTTPANITRWQSTEAPNATLAAKAERYQLDLEARFQTPEGLVDYRQTVGESAKSAEPGLPADGCFHTGIYLASQALRHATTKDPAARAQILRALDGLELLHDVTGKRGLLSRHARRVTAGDSDRAVESRARPGWLYRGDVSKDQYAGAIHGLGVTLALVDDAEIRRRVAALAAAIADHLIESDMRIVDLDGEMTTHGDLRSHVWGLPIGVNALISLAIARVAATATADERHLALWDRLVEADYPDTAYWAHFDVFGVEHRVNDNMSYLAIYPLLLLATSPTVRDKLRESECRSWSHVRRDRNAFFALVHASVVEESDEPAVAQSLTALREFPERKIPLPVDLTRPGFNFPRAFLNTRKCLPRTTEGLPLFLRPVSSSYWAANPFSLVGRLTSDGSSEYAGMDYLLAYWMARFHGHVSAGD
jgi:hypothetical protein